jgi:prephenate dehydrogenase
LVSLVERVTGGEPGVYRDIQTAFDGRQDVAEAAQRLAAVTGDGFDSLYREAGAPHHDTGTDTDRDGGGER